MLKNIKLPGNYFTATSARLLEDLYVPALEHSTLYQRGVAYFSIAFLLQLMDAVVRFVENGGVVHLATSVELDSETIESFANGYLLSTCDVEEQLLRVIEAYKVASVNSCLEDGVKLDVVANMIASRHLVIKVAYVPTGIYHEKIGLFTDAAGDAISFIGSANATLNAYHHNFETINLFTSWENPDVVKQHRAHFTELWNNNIPGIEVVSFPEAVEKEFLRNFKASPTLESALKRLAELGKAPPELVSPVKDEIRPYQETAIAEFMDNGCRHFYEMATGTGKTFTAIKTIERMQEKHPVLNVLILVPLKDLQHQWAQAIVRFFKGDHSIYKFGGGAQDKVSDYNLAAAGGSHNSKRFAAIAVCVYDTYFGRVCSKIDPVMGDTLVIVDEAHNLTPVQVAKLKYGTPYRLGLSATPERFNPKETEAIFNFFLSDGKQCFRFGLKEAIDGGYLSPYEYYPIPVTLTDDELASYQKYTKLIGVAQAVFDSNPTQENQQKLDELKMSRSRVVKKAVNKLEILKEMVNSDCYSFRNSVVFCGPGAVDVDDSGCPEKILDLVTDILSHNHKHPYFPAKYTSGEDDRPARLEDFKDGVTDALVAIKCFDEGLDVPALDKIYIMASDTSRRQTIQRRGRVLRVSKETGKEKAKIFDMVVGEGYGFSFVPLPTECPRVAEYASLSLNPHESDAILRYYTSDGAGDAMEEIFLED